MLAVDAVGAFSIELRILVAVEVKWSLNEQIRSKSSISCLLYLIGTACTGLLERLAIVQSVEHIHILGLC